MATPDAKLKLNHKVIFAPTVGTEFTVYDKNGSDTNLIRYMNFSFTPNAKIAIISDQPIYITECDGEVLEYPMRLDANLGYQDKKTSFTFSFIKLYTVVANTSIRLFLWGNN